MRGRWGRLLYTSAFLLLVSISLGSIHLLRAMMGVPHPLMVVVSQSMLPTLGVGDLILVGSIEDFDDIKAAPPPEGEILVFKRPGNPEECIVHRAIEKYREGDRWLFVTKGDNNPREDRSPISEEDVLGRVVGRIPLLGYLPLLLKTRGGIALIIGLMILILLSDLLMPVKRGITTQRRIIPRIALLLLLPAPLLYLLLLQYDWGIKLETLALLSWYLACLLTPLTVGDDDTCMILWLYHFVLAVIPLACDLVWRLFHITPSMWWYVQGSTVPVSLLLMKETPLYLKAFKHFLGLTMPGFLLFFAVLTAKRRGLMGGKALKEEDVDQRPAQSFDGSA